MRCNLWKDCERKPLTKLLSYIVDNRGKTVPTAETGHILIATNCIKNENLYPVYEKIRYLTEDTYKTWFRAHPVGGDIIFVNKGTPGRVCLVPEVVDFCIAQDMMAFRVNPDIVYNKYLFAILRSWEIQEQIRITSVGDVIPHFKKSHLDELLIPVPPMHCQHIIGNYYFNLSNKIELNNKINDNLEQQAQILFRTNFIDFTSYGGNMPSTWKQVSLDEVCLKITDGSHYSPVNVNGAPYPMYSVKDMETHGFNPNNCKHITEQDFAKMLKSDCVPQIDDILVAKDGSYLKEIFLCSEAKNEAILSSIAIFRPNKNIIIPEILLYLLKEPSVRKDVGDNYVSGSALPRIVLKDFKKYNFALPPLEEQYKIGNILHSIQNKININVTNNRILTTLRNTLIPKLMSGEIDVSQVEA